MQSRLLRYFLTTYRHMSVTAAAAALNVTQPALTKSIKQLEQDLGVPLFDRLPTGVVPTPYGERLAAHATTIFFEYERALADLATMKGGTATLRVGAGPIWLLHFLPPAIVALKARLPDIRISAQSGVVSAMVPELLRGNIDILCGALDFPDHPDLIQQELASVEQVIMVGRHHPLARREEVTAMELLEQPWAMLARDDVGRRHLEAWFASKGFPPPAASLETNSVECILEVVTQGTFATCLSRAFLSRPYPAGLVALPVTGSVWRYNAGIVLRRNRGSNAALEGFVDAIVSVYRERSMPE